jgi:hypothetical protein
MSEKAIRALDAPYRSTNLARLVLSCMAFLLLVMLRAPASAAEQSTQALPLVNALTYQPPQLTQVPATDSYLRAIQRLVMKDKIVEEVLENPWMQILFPVTLIVKVKECGEDDTHYLPKTQEITICLETACNLLNTFYSRMKSIKPQKVKYKQIRQHLRWQIHFVLYHEIAHALIDQLNLPVLGREEDAADTLAAILLLLVEAEDGPQAVLSVAEYYRLIGLQDIKAGTVSWWDEHAVDLQRSYNMLCFVYGCEPKEHKHLVGTKRGRLPKARAERCGAEYRQSAESWVTLLEPHIEAAMIGKSCEAQTNAPQLVIPESPR